MLQVCSISCHRRAAMRQLHRQPQHRKNPTPDHPTDADGHDRPQPNLAVACFAHVGCLLCFGMCRFNEIVLSTTVLLTGALHFFMRRFSDLML